ncbi:MAG: hypothetical protein F4017_06135, partial [Acidimicrobiaceae bacterium]|nr:hypothetical protein [Acidimicrobiaceae bacterium]
MTELAAVGAVPGVPGCQLPRRTLQAPVRCGPVPELPEVETIRAQLDRRLAGRSITDAGSHPSEKFLPAMDAVGGQISAVGRRGKYLIVAFDDGSETGCELVIHLGMTGRLSISPDTDRDHPHLRAWWRLDGDELLTFHDIRRFGRVHVVEAGRYEAIATLDRLGPEPFSDQFTGDGLWRALSA